MEQLGQAVVIGTGAGGLGAAAYLSQAGFDVVALEQARQFGGYLNPFKRRRFEFDPGLHYVGACQPGQWGGRFFEGLGWDPGELFAPMDPDGFDVFQFPDLEIRVCKGIDRYRDRLVDYFPHQRSNIDRFIKVLKKNHHVAQAIIRLHIRQYGIGDIATLLRHAVTGLRWGRATLRDVLDWAIDDPRLADVLAAQGGDYGLPPSKISAPFGLELISHFMEGAYFPRGGSRTLRDKLVDFASTHGAVFERNSKVTQIRLRHGRATEVVTADQRVYQADVVVAAVAPSVTFGELIDQAHLPERVVRRVGNLEYSPSTILLFLGVEGDWSQRGMGAHNIWNYPHWDLERVFEPIAHGDFPEQPFLFVSPNSLKDPSGALAPEGHSTVEVLSWAPYEKFSQWDGGRALFRCEAYNTFKAQVAERVLVRLEQVFPGIREAIVVKEIGTPVTNTFYANAPRGGIYGAASTPSQAMPFRFSPKTPIKNVFLAGSGVFGGSVIGCLHTGKAAANLARKQAE